MKHLFVKGQLVAFVLIKNINTDFTSFEIICSTCSIWAWAGQK